MLSMLSKRMGALEGLRILIVRGVLIEIRRKVIYDSFCGLSVCRDYQIFGRWPKSGKEESWGTGEKASLKRVFFVHFL